MRSRLCLAWFVGAVLVYSSSVLLALQTSVAKPTRTSNHPRRLDSAISVRQTHASDDTARERDFRLVQLSKDPETFHNIFRPPTANPNELNIEEYDVQIRQQGKNSGITSSNVRIVSTENAGINFKATIAAELPGMYEFDVLMTHSDVQTPIFSIELHVVGIALYQIRGEKTEILSGPNSPYIGLMDENGKARTIDAKVYGGPLDLQLGKQLSPYKIQFNISDQSGRDPSPLQWDPQSCDNAVPVEKLEHPCSMAFSEKFDNFSILVPSDRSLNSKVDVVFWWDGMKEYLDRVHADAGINADPDGVMHIEDTQDPLSESAEDGTNLDDVTKNRVTVARFTFSETSEIAGWKIAVIVLVCIAVVIAAVMFVICFIKARRRERSAAEGDLQKKQQQHFSHTFGLLRRHQETGKSDPACYIEEPSSRTSTVLMLENDADGALVVRADLSENAPHRTSRDKKAGRLVLPREVNRGIDLELSTGTFSVQYRPPNEQNETDRTSYGGRGMTSIPVSMYERDMKSDGTPEMEKSHTHSNSVTDGIQEGERGRFRDRPGDGVNTEAAVGAAINRVRQVDLLHGPASRGLVGKHGEPLDGSKEGTDDSDEYIPEKKVISPMSFSKFS